MHCTAGHPCRGFGARSESARTVRTTTKLEKHQIKRHFEFPSKSSKIHNFFFRQTFPFKTSKTTTTSARTPQFVHEVVLPGPDPTAAARAVDAVAALYRSSSFARFSESWQSSTSFRRFSKWARAFSILRWRNLDGGGLSSPREPCEKEIKHVREGFEQKS